MNCLIDREIRPFCRPLFCHSSEVKYASSLLTIVKRLWDWLQLKYPTLTLLAVPAPVRNCDVPPDNFGICTVKSHSHALATFRNIGKTCKQGEAIWIIYLFFLILITFCAYFNNNSKSLNFIKNSGNSVLNYPFSLKQNFLSVKFSYRENTVCNCCRELKWQHCWPQPFAT